MERRKYLIVLMCLGFLLFASIPADAEPYNPDQMLVVTGFTITIDNAGTGSDPDSAWETCSGGALNLEVGGYAKYDDVTLKRGVTGDSDIYDWLNDVSTGKDIKRNVTLKIQNKNGKDTKEINFYDCIPVRYTPPPVDSGSDERLEEEFTFKAERILGDLSVRNGVNIRQEVDELDLFGSVFDFKMEGRDIPLESATPGGMSLVYEEIVGGDEPWDNKPGRGQGVNWVGGDEPWDNKPGRGGGADWVGGDEPWDNKPGNGAGSDWVGGDEPWDNKPGNGAGSDWVGGDEPWDNKPGQGRGVNWMSGDEPYENKPGRGGGADWVGGDEPWDNKPGNGAGSDWVGGDEPWDNKPGNGAGADWVGGDEPWDNKPGWGGGSDWVGGDEPWDNKFAWLQYDIVGVEFDTWTITKSYERTDTYLRDLYNSFADGSRTTKPRDSGKLTYYGADGSEARSINFFGFTPVKYEIINVDSGSGSSSMVEVIEISVIHCEYK